MKVSTAAAAAIGRPSPALIDEHWATGARVLDAALEAASMGPWRYTFHDQMCRYSPRAQELYGLDGADVMHDEEGVRRMLHPDDLESMWTALRAASDPSGDGRYSVEYRVRRPEGGWRWLSVWGLATFATDGPRPGPVMLTGASRDITDRKQAEAFREAQNRALELIVQDAPLAEILTYLAQVVEAQCDDRVVAGILFLDAEGRLRHGAAPSLPDEYNQAVDGLTASADLGTCSAAAATGRVVITPDIESDPRWASIRHLPLGLGLRAAWSQPITARDGRVLGTFGTYFRESRPPTAQEREAVGLLARLAALAIERARGEEALRDAQRRKDEFLATLSHELRNPLAPLRTALHMLRVGPPTAQPQLVATMERQVDQLVRLVDDLLEVSRISRGTLELQRQPVLVTSVVALAVETSQAACHTAGHRLTVSLPDEPVWVHGDKVRLAQALTNLINNAAKYTEPGGHISLSARVQDGQVAISVADTGIGIDSDVMPRLFELFVRGPRASRTHSDGLGIGLALARQLAEMHGGSLQGVSEGLGKGSVFTVHLPVLSDDRVVDASRTPAATASPRPVRRRVLIVDDNVDAAEMTALFLAGLECETHTAHDGKTALALAERLSPDVVLLDIGLPDLSGYEVCERLRQQTRQRPLLVVALSGWGQAADLARSAAAGFDAHLVKPVSPDALADALRGGA